jgi:hypothetical protein
MIQIEGLGHAPKIKEINDKLESDSLEFGGGRLKREGDGLNDLQMYSTDVSDEEDLSSGVEDDMDEEKKRKFDEGAKNKDQIDLRKERNRVLAKERSLRKKNIFKSLQDQVSQLSIENDMLKEIVKQMMGIGSDSTADS